MDNKHEGETTKYREFGEKQISFSDDAIFYANEIVLRRRFFKPTIKSFKLKSRKFFFVRI